MPKAKNNECNMSKMKNVDIVALGGGGIVVIIIMIIKRFIYICLCKRKTYCLHSQS